MTNTVKDAMTASPAYLDGNASVIEAARTMVNEDVGSIPVVEEGRLVGIVTDRDLVVQVMAKDLDPNKIPVSDVCSENPIVAAPQESLEVALKRMATEQIRRLPVVEEGRLVGMLAQADVAQNAEAASTGEMVEQISQK